MNTMAIDRLVLIGVAGGHKHAAAEILGSAGNEWQVLSVRDEVARQQGRSAADIVVREGAARYGELAAAVTLDAWQQMSEACDNHSEMTTRPAVNVLVLDADTARHPRVIDALAGRHHARRDADHRTLVVECYAGVDTVIRRTGLGAARPLSLGPTRKMMAGMIEHYRSIFATVRDCEIDTTAMTARDVADTLRTMVRQPG